MNSLAIERPSKAAARVLAVTALGCCALAANLLAGERIIIGNPGPVASPLPPKQDFEKQDFTFWKAGAEANMRMPMSYQPTPSVMDPREEKRAQQKRDEKRWWLVLGPEELQPKDDKNGLGQDKSGLEDLNTLSRSGDYTFYGLGKDKPRSSKDTDRKSEEADKQRAGREDEESDGKIDTRRARKSLGENFDFGGQRAGREVEMKDPFGSSQATSLSETELTLRDYFAGIGRTSLSPSDELQKSLLPRDTLSASGMPDPKNDLFNSLFDALPDKANPGSGLPRPQTLNRPDNPLAGSPSLPMPPGFGDPRVRQSSPGLNFSVPLPQPKAAETTRPSVLGGSLFMRDTPQRQGVN